MNQDDFVGWYGGLANDISKATGLDPSLVLGQLAQESGWGKSIPGNGTNPFGISPGGKVAVFPSVEAGAQAYVNLVNSRYPQIAKAGDMPSQAVALGSSDYNPSRHGYGYSVYTNAQLINKAGFNVPSADDLNSMVNGDLGNKSPAQTAPAQPPPQQQQQTGAPSADDLNGLVNKDFPAQTNAPANTGAPAQTAASTPAQPKPDLSNGYLGSGNGGLYVPPDNIPGVTPPTPAPRPSVTATLPYQSVGEAMAANYPNTPISQTPGVLSPATQTALAQSHPWLAFATGEASKLGGAANALFRGAQQAVAEGGNYVAPGLGNALAVGMEAVPADMGAAAGGPGMHEPAVDPIEQRVHDLTYGKLPPEAAPREVAPAAPAPAEGAPSAANSNQPTSAAGAQVTPPSQTTPTMTPAEAAAARETVERSQVRQTPADRASPNGVDPAEYVPGVRPHYAAIDPLGKTATGDTNAVVHKTLYDTNPVYKSGVDATNKENNAIMLDHFMQDAGDANAIQQAEAAREAATTPARDAAFANAKPTDAQPVIDAIDAKLAAGGNKRTAVSTALNGVRDSLFDDKGNLETDPAVLYAARQNITDMLSKQGLQTNPAVGLARKDLTDVKGMLDDAIEAGAPGYKGYLTQYQEMSKPIDAMETLQGYLTGSKNITDVQGNLQAGRVQKMMQQLVDARSQSGANPAKSIPDDTMERLFNLRNELSRTSNMDQLARVKGSDTVQKATVAGRMGSMAGSVMRTGGNALLHAGLAKTTGGMGNYLLETQVKPMIKARNAARDAARLEQTRSRLMSVHPSYEGTPAF